MEASPLVQQARPNFQPKIAQLYEGLFQNEYEEQTEGFWSEFFLLKPDRPSFRRRLDELTADDLLHFQHETQQLFAHAMRYLQAGKAPADEVALETLTVFLSGVLSKKYTNPSSDLITVLAGLDRVDRVFTDFANAIEAAIRHGRSHFIRQKAIETALSIVSGAYQTSLASYFTHRDLYPALMKYVQDAEPTADLLEPFLLLGLLANYSKFEYRNPYRVRMEDFVNEAVIIRLINGSAQVLARARARYLTLADDQSSPTSWSFSGALQSIGLGVLSPFKAITPAIASDEHSDGFSTLPGPEAAILLPVYDFVTANKLYMFQLLNTTGQGEQPFATFLSFLSYLLQHAHRSTRATLYGILGLSTVRVIVEDPVSCKRLCDSETPYAVRLCRHRQPTLPAAPKSRAAAASILDIAINTINHNLRRRLDLDLYAAAVNLILRLFVCLAQNHIHLSYHWSSLWHSLLALLRFLQTYASDITSQSTDVQVLITPLLKTLAIVIAYGNSFLNDADAYDDLVYKLVENGPMLHKFRAAYKLPSILPVQNEQSPPGTSTSAGPTSGSGNEVNGTNTAGGHPSTSGPNLIDVLLTTSAHFHARLESRGKSALPLSAREVTRVIREGYESLEVVDVSGMGIDVFEIWRESEERSLLKRVARLVVDDARRIVNGS